MQEKLHIEKNIQKLFNKSNSVLFRWNNDKDWSIDYVSENVSKLLGYSAEEFMQGKVVYSHCIAPNFLSQVQDEVIINSKNNKEFFEHKPYKIITKDKKEKWVLDQTVIDRDENGNITHYLGYINDITHTVELGQKNKELLDRIELAVESTNDGIWDWNIKTDQAYFSDQWKSMLGYYNEEIENVGSAFFSLIHPDDQQKVKDALDAHFKDTKNPYSVEIRLLQKSGDYKWILSRGRVTLDEHGEPERMLGSHIDISKQKEVEKKLEESELRWKFAIEGSGDGLWDWNLKTSEVYFSKRWKSMLGFNEDEIEGSLKEWSRRVNPKHIDRVFEDVQNYIDGKTDRYINEHQVLCKDGTYKWILDRGVIVSRDKDGNPTRMIGTHTDIDHNKKQHEQLQRAQKTAKIGIWELNHLTQELEWSDEIYNIFAIDKKRFKPSYQSFINVIHPDDRDEVNRAFSNSLDTKEPYEINHRLKMDDGSIKYVREQCDTDFDENGIPLISRGTVQDVSDIKNLQNEIVYERNFISTIIESSNAVITVIDSDGKMIKLNSYGENFTGYTQDEISAEPLKWKCLLPPEIQDNIMLMLDEAKKGNIVESYQNAWISKSGEKRMFEWSNTLVKKADGSLDYIVSIGLDITQNEEQKSFLDMLINSQSHMIILTDKYTLKYINEPTLKFFDFESIDEMKDTYNCICDTFEKDDKYFYFDTESDDDNWIDSISKLPKEKQIVSIFSKKEKKNKNFQVNINNYGSEELYVVTFIDISETMQIQSELDYKSKHDPLTNIYNRGFFNEHHHSIIDLNKQSNHKTALAIIDIDHFKSVNDTYGHDVGDKVLINLVELIQKHSRDNDVLIRWGGEEFILLMPINTDKNLLKKLEHLREIIEKTKIETVGNITISIGATFVTDDPIDESIKRADTALYISKNSGRNKVSIN